MPKTPHLSRRRFLQQSSLASGGLLLPISVLTHCQSIQEVANNKDDLFSRFQHPTAEARPFFRWWWNGNVVSPEEIVREIRLMKEAGAGGVEINPIGMHENLAAQVKEPGLEWLSDEWNQAVKTAVEECRRQGMEADLIVGTGWPFGGKFLKDEETIKGVESDITVLEGPGTHNYALKHSGEGDHKLLQLLLVPQPLTNLEDVQDLTDQVQESGDVRINLQQGKYKLYQLTVRNKFRNVMFGAPGADGPVLDHFNRSAVEAYLNHMSDALSEVVNLRKIRSMFCDSIELEGANWTDDFTTEFEQRRGYDLLPYLSLVMDHQAVLSEEMEDNIMRVRYDHSLTLAELFEERFILPFHEWCQRIGVKSRYQAYGYPWLYTDLLQGYLVPDIPEGDQWLFNAGWVDDAYKIDEVRYAIWNKYASSGGHLTGKNIVSSEAMTNTKGVFRASLEYMKQATDLDIVGGINHLVLHGFNYSPPDAGFPGWIRFGTYYNEHNTWWPYVRHWMDYAARLSQIFQNTQAVAQIAILGPTADIWSGYGLERNPFNDQPDYLHSLWQALSSNGFTSDYVNAAVLEQAKVEKGGILSYGPMLYDALIVCSVQRMRPETARLLRSYAEQGGKILFIENIPSSAPGLQDHEQRDKEVRQMMDGLTEGFSQNVQITEAPAMTTLAEWTGRQMQRMGIHPAVALSSIDRFTFMYHHQQEGRELFFFCNSNRDKEIHFQADFQTGNKIPWQWNAETGERSIYPHQNATSLDIHLLPLESLLLVFDPFGEGEVADENEPGEVIAGISGHWEVALNPFEGELFTRTFDKLKDLTEDEELKTFSGTITYRKNFKGNNLQNASWLDLGKVHETAEVWLNSEPLGLKWWGERLFLVDGKILSGENVLEIKVSTLLYNYALSLENNPVAQHWAVSNNKWKEGPLPSGLLGPVEWRASKM